MRQAPARTFAPAMLSAWQGELKATRNPSIKQQCLQRAPELLPRFAQHYQQLKTLRRHMRRSLQRQ
jgi:flagellar hook-associated protein FlgK